MLFPMGCKELIIEANGRIQSGLWEVLCIIVTHVCLLPYSMYYKPMVYYKRIHLLNSNFGIGRLYEVYSYISP